MCTNFTPATPHHLLAMAEWPSAVALPEVPWPVETYPGYLAPMLTAQAGGEQGVRVSLARFGLIPRWCRDAAQATTVGRGTYNARCETVAEKPSFRSAWREQRFGLVPMLNYFEPCWESGRSVRWRIARADGELMWAAALHERWVDPASGGAVQSFSLLTANADAHPLLNRMHRPGDEKRQLRLVTASEGMDWLSLPAPHTLDWLARLPDLALVGQAAPVREDPQGALPFD